MSDVPKLTIEELIERWRFGVTRGTLANWRSRGIGPKSEKLGSRILYPLDSVEEYETQRTKDGRWWKPSKPPRAAAAAVEIDPLS